MTPAERTVRVLAHAGFRPAPNPGRALLPNVGRAWLAVCPVCLALDEPSLGIGEEDDGVRLTCWGPRGCSQAEIAQAIYALARRSYAA